VKRRRRLLGFTLVEVLIATAVLALLMLGLVTAMRSFARAEARIDERIRIDDGLRLSERLLRATMSAVSPRRREMQADTPRALDFHGGSESMRWIGVMPARHGAGGLYRFHLYARPPAIDGPGALVLEFAPFVPGFNGPLDPGAVQSRVLASPIESVHLRYQDDVDGAGRWLDEWPHADRLPRRIGLTVQADRHAWPETVVAVTPAVGPAAAGSGGVTSGPTVGPL
jgi:general secretion pathway protein J